MKEETEKLVKELMENTYSCFLATIDDQGLPFIRAVFNLRSKERFPHPAKIIKKYDDNPFSVYISTNTSSLKIKQIQNNKNVAIYYAFQDEVKGIMLQGQAEIINDIEFKKEIWVEGWERYYPQGYTDTDFTMLKVTPRFLKGWYRGHHVYNFE
jgi:general stress protein 26